MAVLSAQDVERFTPDGYRVDGEVPAGAPVYLIAPLNMRERARLAADQERENLKSVSAGDIARVAQRLVEEAQPTNAPELLEKISAFQEIADKPIEGAPKKAGDEPSDEFRAEVERRRPIIAAYEEILDLLREDDRIARLIGHRSRWLNLFFPMIASHALRGWENTAIPFRRLSGIVPDEDLLRLPASDLLAIGIKAWEMMQVSSAQRGN